MAADTVTVRYVYIPCDPTLEVEERSMTIKKSDEVLGFLNKLKKHFRNATGAAATEKEAAEAHRKALLQQAGPNAGSVPADLLDVAASMQVVESIPLMPNTPETGFVGVNMYCDDSASFKRLPFNQRATGLAEACGLMLQTNGDVFIGRIFDNEDDFERRDFTLSDLSSSSPWVKQARDIQIRKGDRSRTSQQQIFDLQQQAQQAGHRGAGGQPAGTSGSSRSAAEVQKDKGNEAFKKGDWTAALDCYSAALKLDPALLAARNNRAMAYLKMQHWQDALRDCEAVLAAEPRNVKALLRRATAAEGLGRVEEAQRDLRQVLELQPGNKEAAEGLAKHAAASGEQQAEAMEPLT